VKQSDIGEYKENATEKQNIQNTKKKHQLPLKPSHTDAKHQSPPPRTDQQIEKNQQVW
jgi:hypothetical protein